MNVAHCPWDVWATVLPQGEGTHPVAGNSHPLPETDETMDTEAKRLMVELGKDKRLDFMKSRTGHISSFLKARVLQDRLHGLTDVNEFVKNGLAVAAELGLPSLQSEAGQLLENKFRSGKCDVTSHDHNGEVQFGEAVHRGKVTVANVTITSPPWAIFDYADTIPGMKDGSIDDVFGEVITERNQCLSTHLAAGEGNSIADDPISLNPVHVMKWSRAIRWNQYQQA